jgi:hypothetical protein
MYPLNHVYIPSQGGELPAQGDIRRKGSTDCQSITLTELQIASNQL